MAVDLDADDIVRLLTAELASQVRYRVVVLQSSNMDELARLSDYALAAASVLGTPSVLMDHTEFFDGIGAISCDRAWEKICASASQLIVLGGPLHFLDYWSEVTRDVFWRSLASVSNGPGVVVIDAPRNEGIEGPFRLVGKVGDTDIRLLKSRLSVLQDGVA